MIINRTTSPIRISTRSVLPYVILLWFMVLAAGCASTVGKRGTIRPWLVKEVLFSGNASIASSELLDVMETKPGWFLHTVKFSQSLLNADIEAIASLYRDRGFIGISVTAGDIAKDPATRRVTITIVIIEGLPTLLDSVRIRGAVAIPEAVVKRFLKTKPGKPYSTTRLTYNQEALRDSIVGRGYPLCIVDRIDSLDSIAHRACVTFIVEPGPAVTAGPLSVTGTKRLHQGIVKCGLTFRTGDTLTAKRILLSMRQLYETGMFKYVQITAPVADSARQRRLPGPLSLPVVISIEEADFYKVQGGIGYGTYEGVRLSSQASYGNVLGLGRTIGLDGKYSQLIQSLHVLYTAPWFLLLPPTAAADLYWEHHDEVTFTGYLEGLTMSLSAKTSWNLGYRVYTTFEWVYGVTIQPQQTPLTAMVHGNNTQSFGTGFTYDIRDNVFDPTKGLFASSDAELAGLIGVGTNHFYKLIMDVRGYVPLTRRLNAASAAMAGYVNGYGVDKAVVPPQELLYAGSELIRPVRGYAPGGVGDSAGGRLVLALNILELRFALVKWLKIAGFTDAGCAWASSSLFSLRDLRFTAGPGIRIRTPVGMLSTDLGIRLNGPTRGKTGFSISIGEPF